LATATSIAQTLPHKTSLSGFKPNVPELSSKAPSKPSSLPNSAPVEMNRMVVVIDPAHGGLDSGARISDATLEKDVTLAIAFKLRSLLSARGLAVVMTRDADISSEPDAEGSSLTLDDRAGIANHAHPMACLLFHATGTGNGVHLYTSELTAIVGQPTVEPWLTAQAAWVPQSENLEKHLAAALTRSRIALVTSRASVRPVDSLACPALIVELAPSGDDPDSINGSDYQERIAQAIAGSLLFWRNQVEPPPHASASAASENIPSIPVKPAPQRGTLR
jgi:N-acetylmuramoyl-L-alanine amidase